MIEVRRTAVFVEWLGSLRNTGARSRIEVRIDRIALGLFGDVKFFEGIGELRVDYGPGYRVYFVKRGNEVAILLAAEMDRGSPKISSGLSRWPRSSDMATETSPWDGTEFLKTEEDITSYLEAALEDGEPHVVAMALGNIARAKGMSSVAREAGITRETLYKSLSDKGDPKLSTLLGVMKALGLKFTVTSATGAA